MSDQDWIGGSGAISVVLARGVLHSINLQFINTWQLNGLLNHFFQLSLRIVAASRDQVEAEEFGSYHRRKPSEAGVGEGSADGSAAVAHYVEEVVGVKRKNGMVEKRRVLPQIARPLRIVAELALDIN